MGGYTNVLMCIKSILLWKCVVQQDNIQTYNTFYIASFIIIFFVKKKSQYIFRRNE